MLVALRKDKPIHLDNWRPRAQSKKNGHGRRQPAGQRRSDDNKQKQGIMKES